MAVIDTSMDMPKSCDICPKRWKCELDILIKSYFPYNVVKDEYTSKRHKECPLKSADNYVSKEVARRIIDSPRSKQQMLNILDSLPKIGE